MADRFRAQRSCHAERQEAEASSVSAARHPQFVLPKRRESWEARKALAKLLGKVKREIEPSEHIGRSIDCALLLSGQARELGRWWEWPDG